jgi:predicted esterase
VFIINVDDESPDRGSRHPVLFHFQEEATVFWPANTLAVQPVHGMPLTTGTRYALVATDALLSRDGEAFNQDTDLEAVLAGGGDDAVMEAIGLYAPAIAALEEFGVPGESILSLAVFTTQDPVSGLLAARDWVVESYPAPEADARAWRWVRNEDAFALVHGEYGPSPILQAGEVPYPESGGQIEFEAGAPILQGEFNPRFALTVPLTEQPEAGFPIVLYAHGTGGDWQSFIRSDVAARLGELGYAVMGVDQIHHGPRNPTEQSPEGLFFNIINPDAARDNSRQSAIDVVQQARLVSGLEVPNTILAGGPIRFDAERVYFYGHSQGGINGPLFLAIDDQAQGGVLSGAGAVLSIAIIDKTEPIDIATLAGVLLHLGSGGPEEEALVYSHPIITLVQTWLEVSDTANYAHLIFHEPRPGFAPKTILQTEGVNDEFTPPASIEALATATRIPLIEPIIREVPGLTLRGLSPQASGASLNVAGGMATAGLVQLDGGHFVAFREEDGERIVQDFFSSLLEGPPSVRTGVE